MATKKEVKKRSSANDNLNIPKSLDKKIKDDISLLKLVQFNLLFFIPVMLALIFLFQIAVRVSDYFQASPNVLVRIFMIPTVFLIFYFVIPFIRSRENVRGIRYSIVGLGIVSAGIAFPSAIKNHNYSMFFNMFIYVACYILLTFFFCPEVLGMEKSMRDWFKHRKQINIIAIYLSIILFFIVGFGGLYYDVYTDPSNSQAFTVANEEIPSMSTFVYFSMVSFTTTGYGEILPHSPAARLVFFMEALIGLVMNVIFIAILLMFISNAEFLGQQEEERVADNVIEDTKKVKAEEQELKKEEKILKKEEKEIKDLEKEIRNAEMHAPLKQRILAKLKK